MTLDELLALKPLFHDNGLTGTVDTFQAGRRILEFLDTHVKPGDSTLEIGAGVSTVLFALKGADHIAITPALAELRRIHAFLQEHGIPRLKLQFISDTSERALPRLEGEFDLALIDGAHGFPAPFLDWHYCARLLKVGGLLVIDDTQLWTGHVLKGFLLAQPGWELVRDYIPRHVVVRKSEPYDGVLNEIYQPYVIAETRRIQRRRRLRLAAGRMIPAPVAKVARRLLS